MYTNKEFKLFSHIKDLDWFSVPYHFFLQAKTRLCSSEEVSRRSARSATLWRQGGPIQSASTGRSLSAANQKPTPGWSGKHFVNIWNGDGSKKLDQKENNYLHKTKWSSFIEWSDKYWLPSGCLRWSATRGRSPTATSIWTEPSSGPGASFGVGKFRFHLRKTRTRNPGNRSSFSC